MNRLRVAVIGVGHRGLAVLDRVLALGAAQRSDVELTLIEPGPLGVGVHWLDQPDYLMLNTVASQATAFADPAMVSGAPVAGGPTFLEWCRSRDVHLPRRPSPIQPDDFLPRRVWGQYLAWSAEHLLAQTPPGVHVGRHRGAAHAIDPAGEGIVITLDDGARLLADLCFVTTGHGLRHGAHSGTATELDCYPLPDSVAHITADQSVGISGMGLAAVDTVAALTVGRGGRFETDETQLTYVPSGREPSIVLFSRHGRFPCARPSRPRATPRTKAHHLTREAITRLRAARRDRRLDFTSDVMPLLAAEILDHDFTPHQRRLAEAVLATEPPSFDTLRAYRRAVLRDAELDLAEARLGLGSSVFKEAMEVPRDLRQALRDVVTEPGLTATGHRDFFGIVPSLANRAAVGPQLERLEEILALADAGLVELGPGPDPFIRRGSAGWTLRSTHLRSPHSIRVDTLVSAHLIWPRAIGGDDPLRETMTDWVAAHPADERYLRLDPHGHPYGRDGSVHNGVVVLGPPAEGSNYYNNYVLWPGAPSPLLRDIDRALIAGMRTAR